jgi:hypothetical protein
MQITRHVGVTDGVPIVALAQPPLRGAFGGVRSQVDWVSVKREKKRKSIPLGRRTREVVASPLAVHRPYRYWGNCAPVLVQWNTCPSNNPTAHMPTCPQWARHHRTRRTRHHRTRHHRTRRTPRATSTESDTPCRITCSMLVTAGTPLPDLAAPTRPRRASGQ